MIHRWRYCYMQNQIYRTNFTFFFTSFFFTAASMNPVNINNIAETRKNALTVAIFRLQVRGLKTQFYWLMLLTLLSNENIWHFAQHLWNRMGVLRKQHYKVIVKVFIFVKTVLHKIYPDMSNASATEAAVARSLI